MQGERKPNITTSVPNALDLAWGTSHRCVSPHTHLGYPQCWVRRGRCRGLRSPEPGAQTAGDAGTAHRQTKPGTAAARRCRTEARTIVHRGQDISTETQREKRQHPGIQTRPHTHTQTLRQPPEVPWERRKFSMKFDISNNWAWALSRLFTRKCLYSSPQWLNRPELDSFSYFHYGVRH